MAMGVRLLGGRGAAHRQDPRPYLLSRTSRAAAGLRRPALPTADSFFMPGQYVWRDGRYVYVAGYWARVQPGYVWVASHYRWTPYGYVYVAGYWDYSLARRGLLYAPVTVDVAVVGPGFVYMPAYAISDTVMIDAFWVGPGYRHYYFGHYYGPVYRGYGYECCIVYSQRHYDGIVVYAAWDSHDPRWRENRVEIFIGRDNGRLGCPPRTLVEQRIAMRNGGVGVAVMVAPGRRIAADRGIRVVSLNREAHSGRRPVPKKSTAVSSARGWPRSPAMSEIPVRLARRRCRFPRTIRLDPPRDRLMAPPRRRIPRPKPARRSQADAPRARRRVSIHLIKIKTKIKAGRRNRVGRSEYHGRAMQPA